MTPEGNTNDIDQLNSLLRGELSAVETYEQCIEKMDDDLMKRQLTSLQASHVTRATKLKSRIRAMGGEPDSDSGAWGAFAKLVEGGAKIFGKKAALSALEEGEDHGKKDYADVEDLTPEVRHFVQTVLVPEQQRTHDSLKTLKEQV
ncbi:MAG: DUF2383 domain-containing protein [Nannocystaceae bacterium]|nr:PA2169 family four-helix-bundle protein [bacterium]